VNAVEFYGLDRVADRRWEMEVVPALCSGLGALFGGCGLGAAIEILEIDTGRPCVWATPCEGTGSARRAWSSTPATRRSSR
jgi:hypothetical protein